MRLLSSWKHAFLFFSPKNIRLFTLVTIKALVEVYQLLWCYWWILGFLVAFFCYSTSVCSKDFACGMPLSVIGTFIICIATRPSMNIKDWNYIKQSFKRFFGIVLGGFVGYLVLASIVQLFLLTIIFPIAILFRSHLQFIINMSQYAVYLFEYFMQYAGAIYTIFFFLFYLDSDGRWYSIWTPIKRALKLFFYNMPIVLALAVFYILADFCVYRLCLYGSSWQPLLVNYAIGPASLFEFAISLVKCVISVGAYFMFIIPMIVAAANVYIKKAYENIELYVGKYGKG